MLGIWGHHVKWNKPDTEKISAEPEMQELNKTKQDPQPNTEWWILGTGRSPRWSSIQGLSQRQSHHAVGSPHLQEPSTGCVNKEEAIKPSITQNNVKEREIIIIQFWSMFFVHKYLNIILYVAHKYVWLLSFKFCLKSTSQSTHQNWTHNFLTWFS